MKRLWLVFAQSVTVVFAAYFVLAMLKPMWLLRMTNYWGQVAQTAPAAPLPSTAAPALPHQGPAPALPGVGDGQQATQQASVQAAMPGASPLPTPPQSFRQAVSNAAPAVVSIDTSTAPIRPSDGDPWFDLFFGNDGLGQSKSGLGSGVIVRKDGFILTNNHVVEKADQINIVLNDGRHATAKIVGTDPETDLAVLKVDLPNLPVIQMGESSALQVGDRVLAIGNPFGVGQTVTSGIVSALGRNQLGINTFENFIQTDAAINPGNSGGALIDTSGRLIGISSAIYSRSGGSMGIGFAIPVSIAQQVMGSILSQGKVVRGWIGVESAELTPELVQTFSLPKGADKGVIVTGILSRGPAAQAGIRPGDVINQIGGKSVNSIPDLLARIASLEPGKRVTFRLQRQDQALSLDVTPAQRPRSAR